MFVLYLKTFHSQNFFIKPDYMYTRKSKCDSERSFSVTCYCEMNGVALGFKGIPLRFIDPSESTG